MATDGAPVSHSNPGLSNTDAVGAAFIRTLTNGVLTSVVVARATTPSGTPNLRPAVVPVVFPAVAKAALAMALVRASAAACEVIDCGAAASGVCSLKDDAALAVTSALPPRRTFRASVAEPMLETPTAAASSETAWLIAAAPTVLATAWAASGLLRLRLADCVAEAVA
jgi:hypothetical protein